ncbi:MgtC/SapB transporter family protein [Gottschalkia acidurici 9a]|uniref:MgtC/SapB transporter family protein n=1 Tax=Gottschalkia acidurici (strain ATCC 7906 / DSM 604 / BCRC 14475 / CIP 104303 / KCTC 5404 / NCIMB 10678 / 9a) TaxID=1128398 RepID=K0AZ72_GOTA9|nr:MgtC/SapB family protein [Gottschalkia acidurici]AFS78569.1 MgtC/SapB transporter family protein [Gottschalkia acidurici 9a]
MLSSQQIIIRLLLSVVLSGCIGIEREKLRRPAGIRTHILVCIGSTLVMLTSIHLARIYPNVQVDRLGAQVISGIGFLGAGTIIMQGNSVQGLTTAAGLWAVACIGLAIGSGFYLGGIAATLMVLITLILFKKIEENIMKKSNNLIISIIVTNKLEQIKNIYKIIEDMKISIKKIEFSEDDSGDLITLDMDLKLPNYGVKDDLINKIVSQDGVMKVSKR